MAKTFDERFRPMHRVDGIPRRGPVQVLLSTAISGTIATLTTTSALALLARMEGRRELQPINATSHWLHGPGAGKVAQADLKHTAVGYATNHVACLVWALPFEFWLSSRKRPTTAEVIGGAGLVAGAAAVVDYGLVPRRLTPGWEHAVSRTSVAVTFGALAVGLAAGGLLTRTLR